MNANQLRTLALRETDVDGALDRFCGNEQLYVTCLQTFLGDPTLGELETSLAEQRWDDAFTAAHALKGLAGNLGFVPLMHSTGQLVILIRGGHVQELPASLEEVKSRYCNITDAIRQFLSYRQS